MRSIKRVIFGLFILFLFTSLSKTLIEYRKNMGFYEGYKQEYEDEKKRNIALKTEIIKNSDPYEIEKIIRNKLNLVKPNEVAIIVPNPTPTEAILTPTPAPVYQQWLNTFAKN